MAITMPLNDLCNQRLSIIFSIFFLILFTSHCLAQEQPVGFKLTAKATADLINQNINADEIDAFEQNTLTVVPQINASYQSRTFAGLFSGSVTRLENNTADFSQEQTYSEYRYNARWQIFDDLLSIQADGSQNYQNALAGGFLINDFVNNQGDLVKSRSNRIGLSSQITRGDYINGAGNISYSQIRSETNPLINGVALDNDVISGQFLVTQGSKMNRLQWRVIGSVQQSDQAGDDENIGIQGNFTNRNVIADFDIVLFKNWAVRLTGQHEGNQLANATNTFRDVRQFNTYGAGITYKVSDNRYVSLTYNQGDSDQEEDDTGSFVGFDAQWAFTERTGLRARYTRRFFGESGNIEFTYNTKRLRTSFNYSEDVTNNSQLLANPTNLGVFVCPAGETSIGQCFQPSSLDYQPNANEQLVQFSSQNLEINNNVILRKAGNSQIGYSFSKVTLGLSFLYAEETFLDSNAVRRTLSPRIDLDYNFSEKTRLTSRFTYADILAKGEASGSVALFLPGQNENLNMSLGLTHQLGKYFEVTTNVNYIEQKGDLPIGLLGANYQERRVSLGVAYRYE